MLKIRLQRTGKRNHPSFRVVLTDSRNAVKSGSFLEILGSYNVLKGEKQFKKERVKHWISKGAQVSGTVHNMLVDAKIIEGKKVNVSPSVKRNEEEEVKSAQDESALDGKETKGQEPGGEKLEDVGKKEEEKEKKTEEKKKDEPKEEIKEEKNR